LDEKLVPIRRLVDRFERCELTHEEWDHRAHLTVAAWYLVHESAEVATERTVSGIVRFNEARGIEQTRTSGYHETLTRFWLAIVRASLSSLGSGIPAAERIEHVVATYGPQKDLVLEYYNPELIWSWEARVSWVEPDQKPLPTT
jgi:hypothetical protein